MTLTDDALIYDVGAHLGKIPSFICGGFSVVAIEAGLDLCDHLPDDPNDIDLFKFRLRLGASAERRNTGKIAFARSKLKAEAASPSG